MRKDYLAIGVDPGASTGIAVVRGEITNRGAMQFTAVWAESVFGSSKKLLWLRLKDAARAAVERAGDGATAYIETISPTIRRGSIAGVRDGMTAWAGLGQHRGLALGAVMDAGAVVEDLPQREWSQILPIARAKGAGTDRVWEASRLVAGATDLLALLDDSSEAARDRRVDVAEAILIAAAGCLMAARKEKSATAPGV